MAKKREEPSPREVIQQTCGCQYDALSGDEIEICDSCRSGGLLPEQFGVRHNGSDVDYGIEGYRWKEARKALYD